MKIPDRWLDYQSMGKPLKGLPFICFKTPLSEVYHRQDPSSEGLSSEEEFTPSILCQRLRNKKLKLGLVIDLTNTYRYYNGDEEFKQKENVRYVKLKCQGHDHVPTEEVVGMFNRTVSVFLQTRRQDDLIGVHCTHGLNRSGYLLCRYLIDCCGYDPQKAIEDFNEARGHNIEKEFYIEDLLSRKSSKLDNGAKSGFLGETYGRGDEAGGDHRRSYEQTDNSRSNRYGRNESSSHMSRNCDGPYRNNFSGKDSYDEPKWPYKPISYHTPSGYSNTYNSSSHQWGNNSLYMHNNHFPYNRNNYKDYHTDRYHQQLRTNPYTYSRDQRPRPDGHNRDYQARYRR